MLLFTYVDRRTERSPIGGNYVNRRMSQSYGLSDLNVNANAFELASSLEEPLYNKESKMVDLTCKIYDVPEC